MKPGRTKKTKNSGQNTCSAIELQTLPMPEIQRRVAKFKELVQLGENLEEIRSVRWATEEEMNTLAADFLEKPKHGKLGDLYIPPEHKHDAFEYFSKMREL